MAFPDLIEVTPLPGLVEATINVPGSKSATNRLLILAALAEGETLLRGALWSEDTQVMVNCLQSLGFEIQLEPEPSERSNRIINLRGRGGVVPPGGTAEQPLELFVGNAGTATRFLAAFVCLGSGVYRLSGVSRMHQRPQAGLFGALRELGYRVEAPNDRLPAVIHGAGARPGNCRVSIAESSQFASALLLSAARGGWQVQVVGENAEESPYVRLTEHLIQTFPPKGGIVQIEPDASSGSYFLAADNLLRGGLDPWRPSASMAGKRGIQVCNWPKSEWQVDSRFAYYAAGMTGKTNPGQERTISRKGDLGDSIMTAMILAPFWAEPTRFTDLGRLRVQECERVTAMRTELGKCGVRVEEKDDSLTIYPSAPHGAEIDTYEDHRMAMCFAVFGLRVPGIRLRNARCVRKTFPNFFQKLAAPPPEGLGATLFNPNTNHKLDLAELDAE